MGGLTSLLLLLCVGVTVSTVLDLQKRIIGGVGCQNERPYHVQIFDVDDEFICGGSLLNDLWILTAAHCNERGMKVVIGAHLHPVPNSPQPAVVEITAPPVMYRDPLNRLHDIMLLQLPNPTTFQPVELPDCRAVNRPPLNANVRVAGRGPDTADPYTYTLQCADMTVDSCSALRINHPDPTLSMFCGRSPQGRTPVVKLCPGDSGGGVEYNDRIYGVIKGGQDRTLCAPIAIFMDVCRYKSWIQRITGIP